MSKLAVLALACPLLALSACKREPSEVPEGPGKTLEQDRAGEHSMAYGERTVYAYTEPGLDAEVERLFLLLEDLRAESVEISPRTELPIGWTTLTFTVEGPYGERLVVREPDYDGDPESETRADISVSLATLARQRGVLERVGVAGEAIDFDQHVLTVRGVLDVEEVFLVRVASPGGRLTGWRLAPTAGIAEEDELESLPVHAILRERPALLDAMLLPSGYMAFYEGDVLTTVVNERDEVVWEWVQGAGLDSGQRLPQPDRERPGPLLPPLGE